MKPSEALRSAEASSQMTCPSFSKRCPDSGVSSQPEPGAVGRCRGHLQRREGGRKTVKVLITRPGALYLVCKVEERGTPEPALGLQAQGSSDVIASYPQGQG